MNKRILNKVLAIMILISISMLNLSWIGEEVLAANENLENQSTLTNNASVNFDAYFKDENGNKIHTVNAKMNEDLNLYLYGKVAEGYLKDIKVTINNANFYIDEEKVTYGDIESVTDNTVTINRIRKDEELEVIIPIKSIKEDNISLDMFGKQNDISMEAILVRKNSKTKKISKTINTMVNWNEETESTIKQEVLKYIPFEIEGNKGVVLQTLVKTSLLDNKLPVRNTEVNVQIPTINGIAPEKTYVIANTLKATNGNNGLEFNNSNWKIENNIVTIKVNNQIYNNKVNWLKDCQDEYVLTYIYGEDAYNLVKNTTLNITLKADTNITNYINDEISTKNDVINVELSNKINDIVETDLKAKEIINKGYMYTGFETQYNEELTIDVSNENLVNSVIVKENESNFNNEVTNSTFKTTKISKVNFEKILGKDGYIKIYNEDNELIATIDKNTTLDDQNNYIINYNTEIKSLKFETSNIKEIGKIVIENTKIIPEKTKYTEEQIKQFSQIQTKIEQTIINNDKEILNSTKVCTENLVEPITQVETIISNKKLSTLVENEGIDIIVVLKNSEIQCRLFENPVIEIKLPKYIETLKLNDITKILFTDELKVKTTTYNEETKTIRIELEGTQTKYNDITVTEGTTLTLNANIKLDENTEAMQDKIITTVTNKGETANAETVINYVRPNEDDEEDNNITENTDNTSNEEVIDNKENVNNNNTNIEDTQNNIEQNVENTETTVPQKQIADIKVMLESDLKDSKQVKEGQKINFTATVVNIGKTNLNNVLLEANIPEGTSYREFVPGGNYSYDEYVTDNRESCSKNIEVLKPGQSEKLEFQVIVNEKQLNIEKIVAQAIAKIEGYEDTTSEKIESTIIDGALNIDLITKEHSTEKYTEGSEITFIAYVENVKSTDATNVKVTSKIPDGVTFKNAYFAVKMDNDGKKVQYNKTTNSIIWSMNKLPANTKAELQLVGTVNNDVQEIKNQFIATCSETASVSSNEVTRYVDKANLSISQYSNIEDTYINVGDKIEYYITIKNDGTRTAKNVKVIDTLPDGLEAVTLKYTNGSEESDVVECQNKEITLSGFEIEAGEMLGIVIKANVSKLQDGVKGTIDYVNKANVSADGINLIEANEIVHKIKVKNQSNTENTNKSYSISGLAWHDTSRDGKYDDNEQLLKDIEVRLITKDEQVIAKTKTNNKGEYEFKNITNGEYLIIFIYDTTKYEITTYQAKNVVENKNSDVAIQKEDFIDGNITKFGVTDVIVVDNSNINNIDIGLQDAYVFDLSLNKTISKVTVQNNDKIKSYEYKNKTLAKVEIASKDVNNTTVIIEYTFKITNEGNIAGYAKQIVDYLPKDLKFASELNKDWYIGKDGNLYNETLANTLIQPGETQEIKLLVTKTLNDNNLGTTNNSAEIAESYNNYGVDDIDSISGNKSSKEDDYGSADMLISLNTGTIVMYTGLTITMIAIIILSIYMIKKKVLV